MARRLSVDVDPSHVAACVGTKEFVAGVPHWLALRDPSRDTVLYPSLAYPTYEMGAVLARCRAVPIPVCDDGRFDLGAISDDDAARALCLWVNSPGNPAGQLEDLAAVAAWGRSHGVPVFSDECYVEFTWDGPGRTVLEHGLEGLIAVHSLSKRSNLAGVRVGFFAGDPELVGYLAAVRRHAGFMVAGPVQHAAAVAFGNDEHVDRQREVYRERLERFSAWLGEAGLPVPRAGRGFLPVGACAAGGGCNGETGRVRGLRPRAAPGVGRRDPLQSRRCLRAGGLPAMSVLPWCSRWSASSSPPSGSCAREAPGGIASGRARRAGAVGQRRRSGAASGRGRAAPAGWAADPTPACSYLRLPEIAAGNLYGNTPRAGNLHRCRPQGVGCHTSRCLHTACGPASWSHYVGATVSDLRRAIDELWAGRKELSPSDGRGPLIGGSGRRLARRRHGAGGRDRL